MFRYEVRGPAAWLIIDDPDRRNPLSLPVMEELRDALGTAAADRMVRVVVVTGAGDRAFSAGGDLAGGFFDKPLELHHQRGRLCRRVPPDAPTGKANDRPGQRARPRRWIRAGGGLRHRRGGRAGPLWDP